MLLAIECFIWHLLISKLNCKRVRTPKLSFKLQASANCRSILANRTSSHRGREAHRTNILNKNTYKYCYNSTYLSKTRCIKSPQRYNDQVEWPNTNPIIDFILIKSFFVQWVICYVKFIKIGKKESTGRYQKYN